MTPPTAVVFEPHLDDADWWTGGLSCLLSDLGWDVVFACCFDPQNDFRKQCGQKSAEILGVRRHLLNIPRGDWSSLNNHLREALERFLPELQPEMVFLPPVTDYHAEHVVIARELLRLFAVGSGIKTDWPEIYAYDSSENRRLIDCYIDITTVWARHAESLRALKFLDQQGMGENNLLAVKTARARMLGRTQPTEPIPYAEGYRLLQGHKRRISTLPDLLGEKFIYRNASILESL